jgi:hypothetical protein
VNDTFKDHKLIVIEEWNAKTQCGEYIFKRPNTSMYSMNIIFRPSTIIVYGDVQPNVIFRQSGIDLPWLNGSVDSADYLFEKAVAGVQKEYDEEATKKHLKELLASNENEEYSQVVNEIDWAIEPSVADYLYNNFEMDIATSYKHCQTLLDGLRAFVSAIKSSEPQPDTEICKTCDYYGNGGGCGDCVKTDSMDKPSKWIPKGA